MAMWYAHSDGACKGNPGPAAWGVVVISPDAVEKEMRGYIGEGTNNIAELTAAIKAVEATPEGAKVTLSSDSQYTLKGLTEWRKGWEKRGYKNSKGETIANLELWKTLYHLVDKRDVRTHWVKGHNGEPYNERCDALANSAITGDF